VGGVTGSRGRAFLFRVFFSIGQAPLAGTHDCQGRIFFFYLASQPWGDTPNARRHPPHDLFPGGEGGIGPAVGPPDFSFGFFLWFFRASMSSPCPTKKVFSKQGKNKQRTAAWASNKG